MCCSVPKQDRNREANFRRSVRNADETRGKHLNIGRTFLKATAAVFLGAGQVSANQTVTCLIEPYEIINLSPPVAGVLEEVPVDRGDIVAAGQILARLDTSLDDLRVEMAEARADSPYTVDAREARFTFLSERAERILDLANRAVLPRTEYEEAAAEAEAARLELEAARFDREMAAIDVREATAIRDQKILRSPVNGIVLERRASVGEYHDGAEPILTLVRLDPLLVESFVPIALFSEISVGDVVFVEPEEPIGGRYEATISVIDRVFDAGTGTVGVRLELPNPDLSMPAGLRCRLVVTE